MSTRFIPVFAPISDELLFIGSTNSVLDQYYLILFNFSDPSNYIWKKSIACETTSCSSESSRSLYSLKFNTIFTLIPFGGHILLYEVNATDGSPLNPGYLLPFRGSFNVFAIEEFDNLIAIQLFSYAFSPPYALLTIDPGKSNGIKVFKSSSGKTFYGIGRVSYQGVEIMYQCGRTSSTNVYFERNAISRNGEYNGFANSDVHFTPITDKYQIKTTTSTPGLYLANKNLAIFSETTSKIIDAIKFG